MAKILNLTVSRNYFKTDYIIGKLFIEDEYICDTLEPAYENDFPAIPQGTYKLSLGILSPSLKNKFPYNTLCNGCPPRLLSVPGRKGILLHCLNKPSETKGCIGLGVNNKVGELSQSITTFSSFYKKLLQYDVDDIFIHVINVPLTLDSIKKCVINHYA